MSRKRTTFEDEFFAAFEPPTFAQQPTAALEDAFRASWLAMQVEWILEGSESKVFQDLRRLVQEIGAGLRERQSPEDYAELIRWIGPPPAFTDENLAEMRRRIGEKSPAAADEFKRRERE